MISATQLPTLPEGWRFVMAFEPFAFQHILTRVMKKYTEGQHIIEFKGPRTEFLEARILKLCKAADVAHYEPKADADPCLVCHAVGFKASVISEGQCEFCDGTEGGAV